MDPKAGAKNGRLTRDCGWPQCNLKNRRIKGPIAAGAAHRRLIRAARWRGLACPSDFFKPAADEELAIADSGHAPNGESELTTVGKLQIDALALKKRLEMKEAHAA